MTSTNVKSASTGVMRRQKSARTLKEVLSVCAALDTESKKDNVLVSTRVLCISGAAA